MKKIIFLFCLILLSASSIYSQEVQSKLSFSGYKVIIVPSDIFSVEVQNPDLGSVKILKNGVVSYEIIDQSGRVPKDTVTIYTNRLDFISLHNSVLAMKTPLLVDSVRIVTAASHGILNVEANYISTSIAAGSQFSLAGTTKFLNCAVGAGSHLDARKLVAEEADVDVMGHSSLTVNVKKMGKEKVENASVKNVYEPQD